MEWLNHHHAVVLALLLAPLAPFFLPSIICLRPSWKKKILGDVEK